MSRVADIQLHQGKTRAWNRAGIPPEATGGAWGRRVATCWNHGVGQTMGSEQYISEKMEERVTKERALWEANPTVPDLQCAWQILLQSHDEGTCATGKVLLDGLPAADSRDRESSTGHASDADGRSGALVATGVG